MSTMQPFREVRERGLEAWDAEEGRMMWELDSRVMDTVEALLKVGRRIPAGCGPRLAMSLFSLLLLVVVVASFELSSTAVGGGTSVGGGERSRSGVWM